MAFNYAYAMVELKIHQVFHNSTRTVPSTEKSSQKYFDPYYESHLDADIPTDSQAAWKRWNHHVVGGKLDLQKS